MSLASCSQQAAGIQAGRGQIISMLIVIDMLVCSEYLLI